SRHNPGPPVFSSISRHNKCAIASGRPDSARIYRADRNQPAHSSAVLRVERRLMDFRMFLCKTQAAEHEDESHKTGQERFQHGTPPKGDYGKGRQYRLREKELSNPTGWLQLVYQARDTRGAGETAALASIISI